MKEGKEIVKFLKKEIKKIDQKVERRYQRIKTEKRKGNSISSINAEITELFLKREILISVLQFANN